MIKIIAKSSAGGMIIDSVYEVTEECAGILCGCGRAKYQDDSKNTKEDELELELEAESPLLESESTEIPTLESEKLIEVEPTVEKAILREDVKEKVAKKK